SRNSDGESTSTKWRLSSTTSTRCPTLNIERARRGRVVGPIAVTTPSRPLRNFHALARGRGKRRTRDSMTDAEAEAIRRADQSVRWAERQLYRAIVDHPRHRRDRIGDLEKAYRYHALRAKQIRAAIARTNTHVDANIHVDPVTGEWDGT